MRGRPTDRPIRQIFALLCSGALAVCVATSAYGIDWAFQDGLGTALGLVLRPDGVPPKSPDLLFQNQKLSHPKMTTRLRDFAGFSSASLCSVVRTVQRCSGGVVYESMTYKLLN